MACLGCGRGFHNECENDGCTTCHADVEETTRTFKRSIGIGAPVKNTEDINDPYSTGRKRAAIQYPLFRTNPCEWRGKKNCGGGTTIIGCIKGLQQDRHHGPVKNPLRNEPGNVHRICKTCHNRWHEVNDSIYDEKTYDETSHSPEPATELELLANEADWKMRKYK